MASFAASANDQDKRSSTHSIAANIEDTTDSKSTPGAVRRSEQPENIARYRIQRVLGKGAFACVYLAYDEELHREVAIEFAETMQVFAGHRCELYPYDASCMAP